MSNHLFIIFVLGSPLLFLFIHLVTFLSVILIITRSLVPLKFRSVLFWSIRCKFKFYRVLGPRSVISMILHWLKALRNGRTRKYVDLVIRGHCPSLRSDPFIFDWIFPLEYRFLSKVVESKDTVWKDSYDSGTLRVGGRPRETGLLVNLLK